MNLLLLATLLAVAVDPETAHGRRGGRGGKQKKSGLAVPNWSTDEDTLPISCVDENEFASRMAHCVVIWQNYCKCEHCVRTCDKDDWPPAETASWNRKRVNDRWKSMKEAWKWSGECARNSTSEWRKFCSEVSSVMNTSDPRSFQYWFLVELSRKSEVPGLCQAHECAKWEKPAAATAGPQMNIERGDETTTNPASDKNLDILEALGPDQEELPKPCNRQELTRLLQRCTFIWQAYCRCTGCYQTCDSEWPPERTAEWGSYGRAVGWENQDTAWQWAGKCAYNATYLWRSWCGDGTPETAQNGTSGKEHEYWFLTELRAGTHPKMVEALCEKNECWKWKEVETNTSPITITAAYDTKNHTTPDNWHVSEVVPRWAYVLIAALVAVLILLLLAIVSCYFYRKSALSKRSKDGGGNLRGQTSLHVRRTTDNSTSWPQTSFAFFGTQALPGVDDSIYHTIGEAPLPTSPVFSFESFSPKTRERLERERSAKSVKNVLYQDTVPTTQQPGNQYTNAHGANMQHAYEDTVPLPGQSNPMPAPPTTPPYFVPISHEDVPNPTCEYDTLGDMVDVGQLKAVDEIEIGENEQAKEEGGGSSNYDHIKLI